MSQILIKDMCLFSRKVFDYITQKRGKKRRKELQTCKPTITHV